MRTGEIELTMKSSLLGTGLVQPVSSSSSRGRLEVLCRQVPGQEAAWLRVVGQLLEAQEDGLHVCRRYVRRDGRMVFGWHLGLETRSVRALGAAVAALTAVLEGARPTLTGAAPAQDAGEGESQRDSPSVAAPPSRPLPAGVHPKREAYPRPPGPSARVPPPQESATIKVISHEVDEDGNVVTIEEMPLPHVYGEMNRPTAGGRGASRTTSRR